MAKRRSHGKIGQLPVRLRFEVERQLINGVTYVEISKYLISLGYDISYMSIYRYGKPFLERFEAVKMAKQTAEVILKNA